MEAAELLGVSERTFRRWRDRHQEFGRPGLDDRRLAPSLRRAPAAEIERMLGLYRDLYRGFTVQHFHEQLHKRHNYVLGCRREGLMVRAKTRPAHRKKRPRRLMVGMMLHQDASTHAWLPREARAYDLVVTMEDATCALYSAPPSWWIRRARDRASGECARWWRGMACSARSTPTAAATTSSPRRPAARYRRPR